MIAVPDYPRRHPITAEEYVRMAEAGVFHAEARLELMDGEIIEMAPIGSPHAALVNTLNRLLIQAAADRAIVSVQNPVVVGSMSVPQPDLMLLRNRADRYFGAHPAAGDVLLVVEVADTTLRFDLERKIPMYGRAGIAEAWLVDVAKRQLRVFTEPDRSSGYRSQSVAGAQGKITIAAMPAIILDTADLFPE